MMFNVGDVVKVEKPACDDPLLSSWTEEHDPFEGRTLRVRSVEDDGWNLEVTLEGAKNQVTYFRFLAEWLVLVETDEFRGFCDACGGFRTHKMLCPVARDGQVRSAGSP
jgi:hypothetical protein